MKDQSKPRNVWKILTIVTGIVFVLIIVIGIVGFIAFKFYNNYQEEQARQIKIEQQKKSADEAITVLKKLETASDIGINKMDYSKLLIETIPQVNKASEQISDGALKQEIKSAMDSFVDAKNLWSLMKEDETVTVCEKQPDLSGKDSAMADFLNLACNPEGGELTRKYKIPIRPYSYGQTVKNGQGLIIKKEGIGIIWKTAEDHITRASALNK